MPDALPAALKCVIKNLDTGASVTAQFNPKELQVDKQVPWSEHKSRGDHPPLEFTSGDPLGLSVELLFDTYESRANVHAAGVAQLQSFTMIVDDEKKRPPMCLFLWGKHFPSFMGVIESFQVRYTMFLADGRPVRATCALKLKQADTLSRKDGAKERFTIDRATGATRTARLATAGDRRRADRFGANHRAVLDTQGSDDGVLEPGRPVWSGTP